MSLELLYQFGQLTVQNPLVVALGIGIVRSMAGWLENVAKEWRVGKQLQRPSPEKFIETLFRVLPQELGLSAIGLPGASLISDYIIKKAKK